MLHIFPKFHYAQFKFTNILFFIFFFLYPLSLFLSEDLTMQIKIISQHSI